MPPKAKCTSRSTPSFQAPGAASSAEISSVAALGDLPGLEMLRLLTARAKGSRAETRRLPAGLLVVEEELAERQLAGPAAVGAARPRRRAPAVPARCRRSARRWRRCRPAWRGIADLHRGEALQRWAKAGQSARQRARGVSKRHAAPIAAAVGGRLDALELVDPAQVDQVVELAELLGRLEPDVGGAGDAAATVAAGGAVRASASSVRGASKWPLALGERRLAAWARAATLPARAGSSAQLGCVSGIHTCAAPHRGSAGSRCSGTGCRRAPLPGARASRVPARRCASCRVNSDITMPGVQKPH